MPKIEEFAEIVVNGQRFRDWLTVAVTASGIDLFSHFTFTAASPVESAPNFAGLKLRIGDACKVYLAGRKVIDGRIHLRQPAYDATQHGLMIGGKAKNAIIGRATVDHGKGEFKGYSLEAIANTAFAPHGVRFSLKGDTEGASKPFEKVNVQAGETVFAFVERLCRMRNIYMLPDVDGNVVGYRLGKSTPVIAALEEGRNIKKFQGTFDYQGAYSEVEAVLQRPGNDEHHGDDARDVSAKVSNPAVKERAPLTFMGEMPGDKDDALMRARHENGENTALCVNVDITVQGWLADDKSLWLEHIGDIVKVYSPLGFTDDWMRLAIQAVTSTQGPDGTHSVISLVLPDRYNGGGQVDATAAKIPNLVGGV